MHNILVDSFSSDTSKEDIATQLKLVAQRDCGKLYQPIEFIDKVFDTIDDANAYLESHDKKYRNFAVKYYDTSDYCQSAETINLQDQYKKAYKSYIDLQNKFHFAEHKSLSITCRNCNSRINLSFLKRNTCPVCFSDLRPKTVTKKILFLKEKSDNLHHKFLQSDNQDRKKAINKSKTNWLVKIEYHT